ncbi:Yip1 family protein [Bacillus sp. T33-2]|uniref:Yip1 family protein n=1 Tax=Bacillus sp. T33-2 TaxID=2054168 RepID=UPI000C7578A9|nr:Yip1 family protein [Bacillus sp. T33-2]PLR95930.1 YIP1 family protein [Bacillus sp. T33-2]
METNVKMEQQAKVNKPSLFGMILSPSLQFERMREKAPIGLPLTIILLLMTVTGAIASFISLRNPIFESPEMEALNIPVGFTVGTGAVGGLFGGAVVLFLMAAILKGCVALMGKSTPYKKVLAILIYSSIISALGVLINGLIALALGGDEASYTSLAPLVADNQMLYAIAKSFDIFQIWYYIVLAIGLHIVTGLSKNKTIILVVILFVIGVGFASIGGLVPQPGV